MDHIQIETTQHVAIDYETANIGDRLAAELVDLTMQFAYYIGIGIMFGIFGELPDIVSMILFTLPLFYHLILEVVMNGQTIGKKAMKVRVLRLDGGQANVGNYLLRWAMRLIEVYMTFGAVAIIAILASRKGQRLGDMMAGTTVVKLKKSISLDETILTAIEEDYQARYTEVNKLQNEDIATIKEVLLAIKSSREEGIRTKLQAETTRALETRMGIQADLPEMEFLETVVKDYNAIMGNLPENL